MPTGLQLERRALTIPRRRTYSQEVLADSPAFFFRQDDASKAQFATMADSSGNARDGGYWTGAADIAGLLTYDTSRATDLTPGSFGGSYYGGPYISTIFGGATGATRQSCTWECLVKLDTLPSGVNGYMLFAGGNGSNQNGFYAQVTSAGAVIFRPGGNNAGATASTWTPGLVAGGLYHLAFTHTNSATVGSVTLYINGASQGASTNNSAYLGTNANSSARFGLWNYGPGNALLWPLDGKMDELAYYPSVLSAGRILAHSDRASGL